MPPKTVYPDKGDRTPEIIYAAVGYAMSRWEELELSLFSLFAKFAGLSLSRNETMQRYSEDRVFHDRFQTLYIAFTEYCIRHPNQRVEGDFDALFAKIQHSAVERNNISHSIVVLFAFQPTIPPSEIIYDDKSKVEWCLISSYYSCRQQIFGNGIQALDFSPSFI